MLTVRTGIIPAGILVVFIALAGCMGNHSSSSYSVDSSGVLSVSCEPLTISEEIQFTNETYTKTKIVMHTQNGDVVTYLAAPEHPKAAIVYVPGAVKNLLDTKSVWFVMLPQVMHFSLWTFAVMEGRLPATPSIPGRTIPCLKKVTGRSTILQSVISWQLNRCFLAGSVHLSMQWGPATGAVMQQWQQALIRKFSGYVGISTSDWGILDSAVQQGYSGNLIRFAHSLEPSSYFAKISPRPVWIFHSVNDSVIPFDSGKQFFKEAYEPKTFIEFFGEHGINTDVDDRIIMQWAQIYATRE